LREGQHLFHALALHVAAETAARIDGCSELCIIWRIVLPLTPPAATAFAIFSVVSHYNDLFWPLIVIGSLN
jgi:multiple sugar transport system permease protein